MDKIEILKNKGDSQKKFKKKSQKLKMNKHYLDYFKTKKIIKMTKSTTKLINLKTLTWKWKHT